MAVAEQLGQISLHLADERLEGSMLDEVLDKAYHPLLHLLLGLLLAVVCENLHA